MPPAARITDMHVCPMVTGIVPHVGGPILPPCAPTVLIGYLPAARVTDMATCVGPPDIIVMGSPTVLINNLMAARIGDPTAHGGVIILGCFTVIIGEVGMGSPGAPGTPSPSMPATSDSQVSTPVNTSPVVTEDAVPSPKGFSGEGGKLVYKDDNTEIKTGVSLKKDGKSTSYNDAIEIKVKCNKNPHVVQFISREIIGADGKPKKTEMKTTGGKYETTTDPKNPIWNTDSAAKPNPNYEAAGANSSSPGQLTIYDQPSLLPNSGETWRATFKSFLICDGKIIREVTWVRSQKDGEKPLYNVNVEKASSLPEWAKNQMKSQGYKDAP